MKRAPVKQAPAALVVKKRGGKTKEPRALRPLLNCTRPGCTNTLTPSQRKYCSHECRNIVMTGGIGGAEATEKYRPEFATTKLQEYLALCEKKNELSMVPTESSYLVIRNADMPSVERYAHFLGVHPSTPTKWSGRYLAFSKAMDLLKAVQRSFLINNGLAGRYDSSLTKLILGVNHGMIERKEVDNTHKLIGVVKMVYDRADEIRKERYGN